MRFMDQAEAVGRRGVLRAGLAAAALPLAAGLLPVGAARAQESGGAAATPLEFTMGGMRGRAYEALSSPLQINEQLYIQVLTSLELTNALDKPVRLGILDRKFFKGFDSRAIFYGLQSATGIGEGESLAVISAGQTARVVMQFISGRQDTNAEAKLGPFSWFDYSGTIAVAETPDEIVNYSLGFRVPGASFG